MSLDYIGIGLHKISSQVCIPQVEALRYPVTFRSLREGR